MRKEIVRALIIMSSLMLLGCASGKSPTQTSDASKASEVPSSQITTSTEELPKSESAAKSKKVEPVPATLKDTLDNCMVNISFSASDVYLDDNEKPVVHMTVYDYELFDLVDISQLTEGDTIVIDKQEIAVKSLDRVDKGLTINGGLENDGFYLITNEDGVYFEIGMNDAKSYHAFEEVTLPLSKDFIFLDTSNLEKPEQKLYLNDFLTNMKNSSSSFSQYSTTATIENGFITNITQVYIP